MHSFQHAMVMLTGAIFDVFGFHAAENHEYQDGQHYDDSSSCRANVDMGYDGLAITLAGINSSEGIWQDLR
jgi:hypothetical protein